MISFLTGHLVESTLFALVMGQLTLCFANNSAAVRYGLWFAASIKFLIPFSLIVAAGSALRWETAPAVADLPWALPADLRLPEVFTGATAPLVEVARAPLENIVSAAPIPASGLDLQTALLALWLAGIAVLLFRWRLQWVRLADIRRTSVASDIPAPVPVRFSRTLFEPGLIGVINPVLLLPEGITAQLSSAQLALVIEHELCHWRRRDNLTAAIHMAVQLVFWFHPLVWWIGKCLVAERERACDETVIAAGGDPKAYAHSILEVCRFYVRAPLACTSGVAGANLKHRVRRIMEDGAFTRLGGLKLTFLALIAAGVLVLPLGWGVLTPEAAAAPAPAATPPEAPPVVRKPAPQVVRAKPRPAVQRTIKRATGQRTASVSYFDRAAAFFTSPMPATPALEEIALRLSGEIEPEEEQVVAASLIAMADAPSAAPIKAPVAQMEEVVITAKKIREFVRTRNFVRSYTAPSDFLDQISRWHEPVCVDTEGLAPAYNAFVTKRVNEIAAEIGAPRPQSAPCRANLVVIFSDRPQAVFDYINAERPDLLGPHYPAMRKTLTTVSHPVQALYATATRDMRGRLELDSYIGWGETVDGTPPVYNVPGSHLRTGLSSEFASVVIVADKTKIGDWEIGTIADYVAMMAFARMKTPDKCQQVPSITNALENCADAVRAKTMSAFDTAYLKALYTSTPDAPRGLQESGISRTMVKILEKQIAGK